MSVSVLNEQNQACQLCRQRLLKWWLILQTSSSSALCRSLWQGVSDPAAGFHKNEGFVYEVKNQTRTLLFSLSSQQELEGAAENRISAGFFYCVRLIKCHFSPVSAACDQNWSFDAIKSPQLWLKFDHSDSWGCANLILLPCLDIFWTGSETYTPHQHINSRLKA